MSFNGAGTYSLPAGNPVITGTTISSTVQNNTMSDIATALSNCVTRDGQSPLTANMPMGGFKQTNLGAGSALTESANLGQVQNQGYLWGGVATGTANALSIAVSPLPAAWAVGQTFKFKSGAAANSGATTIAITGGPAAIAVQVEGAACVGGEIQPNTYYSVTIDTLTTCQLALSNSANLNYLKTAFASLVGTQIKVSADLSPLWWGTQSTLTSGAAYTLNGNILIMEARCHNTQIDTSGNFTGVSETGIATVMFWGEDDVLRVFTAPSVTVGTVPTFGTSPTYTLDMKTGIEIAAPSDAFVGFGSTTSANTLIGILSAPCRLNFRNPALNTGGTVSASVTTSLTLTVPSGATLGTANGVAAKLVWLVAYNGGSPVLCVVNLAGGLQLDESNLISPTTISGASNSVGVIYSASAVGANSPYRVIGMTIVTEATAGTWATAPTTVQPAGGLFMSGLGGASFATNGYQKLPSGMILQWGTASASAGAGTTSSFPVTFPDVGLAIVTTATNQQTTVVATIVNPSQFNLVVPSGTPSVLWMAVGF